jgi:Spy/CpxP family protein refolding chaperone
MKRMCLMVVVLVVSVIFVFSMGSFAMAGPAGHMHKDKFVERLSKDLKLTPEQKTILTDNFSKTEAVVSGIQKKNKKLMDDMDNEIQKDNADSSKITMLINQLGQNDTQIKIVRANSIMEFKKTLTPEQKKLFKERFNKKRWPNNGFKRGEKGERPLPPEDDKR